MEEELKIVDKFFRFREEKFVDELTRELDVLENNKINLKREETNKLLESIIIDNNVKEKILNNIDNIILDYDVAMAHYNKEYYRKGFLDAINIRISDI